MSGRPTLYSPELTDRICLELIEGKSLVKICDGQEMPHRATVLRWLGEHTDFATKYARARESQADLMDDFILDVANAATSETAAADRVKIGAYQWRASKLLPKKYGDRREISGPDGGPIRFDVTGMTDEQLAALEAALGTVTDAAGGDAVSGEGGESET